MAEKRRCEATNAEGKPCGAQPLKPGTEIEGVKVSGRWCRQHDPDIPESGRIGGAQPGAGRPPLPRPTDVARKLIEDHIEVTLTPHFRALGWDIVRDEETDELTLREREGGGVKLFGESKDGEISVSHHDDIGGMIAAAEKLLDRVYGRPKQTTELSGEVQGGGDTIFIVGDQPAEWHQRVTEIAAAAEAAKSNGGTHSGNGSG